eukprot:scaffold317198_cov17-Tisochrysis_lutea.AAC.1
MECLLSQQAVQEQQLRARNAALKVGRAVVAAGVRAMQHTRCIACVDRNEWKYEEGLTGLVELEVSMD